MHFTLRQLHLFSAVARHLSFTRASEELYLTQPAVSMQIKQLEENIGLPLFEHTGKRILLTEAGTELAQHCDIVLQQLKTATDALMDLKACKRGRLNIGVVTSANSFSSQALAAFRESHERISMNLRVLNHAQVIELLLRREIDLAIMGMPPKELDFKRTAFMENPLVVVAAPDHPLAGQGRVSVTALVQETLLVRERGSGTRRAMEHFLAKNDIQVESEIEMGSCESIKQAVQARLGLGIVSLHSILLELETGRLVVLDVEQFPVKTYWYVVHHADKPLSPLVQEFKSFVVQHASRFVFHHLPAKYFQARQRAKISS